MKYLKIAIVISMFGTLSAQAASEDKPANQQMLTPMFSCEPAKQEGRFDLRETLVDFQGNPVLSNRVLSNKTENECTQFLLELAKSQLSRKN